MNAAEHQDAGRTVTRRRHVIVARQRPAGLNAIRHNGAIYTLRVTRFGKLILTK